MRIAKHIAHTASLAGLLFKDSDFRLDERIRLIADNKILSTDIKLLRNGQMELQRLQRAEINRFELAVKESLESRTLAESFQQNPLVNVYQRLMKHIGGEEKIHSKGALFFRFSFPCHLTAEHIAGGARAVGAEFITFHSNPEWSIEYSAELNEVDAVKKIEESPARDEVLYALVFTKDVLEAAREQLLSGSRSRRTIREFSQDIHPYRLETEGMDLVRHRLRPMKAIPKFLYPAIIGNFIHSGDYYGIHFEDSPTPTDLRFRVDQSFVDKCANGYCYLH